MGIIKVTYEHALERYPDQVQEVEAKIRKSKSKMKDHSLSTFDWGLLYVETIQARLASDSIDESLLPTLTSQEKLDRLRGTVSASLQATKGKSFWFSRVIPELPLEIYEARKAQLEEEAKEA